MFSWVTSEGQCIQQPMMSCFFNLCVFNIMSSLYLFYSCYVIAIRRRNTQSENNPFIIYLSIMYAYSAFIRRTFKLPNYKSTVSSG